MIAIAIDYRGLLAELVSPSVLGPGIRRTLPMGVLTFSVLWNAVLELFIEGTPKLYGYYKATDRYVVTLSKDLACSNTRTEPLRHRGPSGHWHQSWWQNMIED